MSQLNSEQGPGPIRRTLSNGLRVVIDSTARIPRVATAVHYGVGFRSEPPAREGFAHLFEHLMFRGSENLPEGSFYDHIVPFGGSSGGTTHQDYTDFFQVTPVAMLERALFAEADRMRAPVFTPSALAVQLDGIEQEIREAISDPPYGGLRWPLLPAALYRSYANAHNGYGRIEDLRAVPFGDFEDFHRDYYAPNNAVLTVVGGVRPQSVLAMIERHFGDIPPRPIAAIANLAEPDQEADRWLRRTRPDVTAPAVALGYRLPDPGISTTAYLGHLALAEIVRATAPIAVDAGCGLFGPFDARDPDVFIVVGMTEPDVLRNMAERYWSLLSCASQVAEVLPRALADLILEHHRRHADLQDRARALGRFELLFDDARLLDGLPGMIATLAAEDIARAAQHLGNSSKAVVVIEHGPDSDPTASAVAIARSSESPCREPEPAVRRESRPLPAPILQPDPTFAGYAETLLDNGLRVIAIRDDRAPVIEVRLRCPYGAAVGPTHTGMRMTSDSEWLDISAAAAAGLDDLLSNMAAAVSECVPPPASPLGSGPDAVLRHHWSIAAQQSRPSPRGSVLVAVGDLDPDYLLQQAHTALSSWAEPAWRFAPWRADDVIIAANPHPGIELAWSWSEPAQNTGSPARYLAIAVAGIRFAERMSEVSGAWVTPGRDVFLGRPRMFLKAKTSRAELDAVVALTAAEVRRALDEPPGTPDIDLAAAYCGGQLLGCFDSPSRLADAVRLTAAAGREPNWLLRLPERLRAVTRDDMAVAMDELFGSSARVLAATGSVAGLEFQEVTLMQHPGKRHFVSEATNDTELVGNPSLAKLEN
ncbi:insulinase family protein [Nocardia sp. KC 131]|uniref:M16 family metallopeptidase n=1 Tax=Nocardia arseniciresistens TaxID=3392119 RepID=UPI00398E3CAA